MTVYFQGLPLQKLKIISKNVTLPVNVSLGFVDIVPEYSFVGNITQVNLFQRLLSSEEIKDKANCKTDISGDLLAWNSPNWIIKGAKVLDKRLLEVCSEKQPNDISLIENLNFYDASYLCEGIGGQTLTPNTTKNILDLISNFEEEIRQNNCTSFWTGIWDEEKEGTWRYHGGNRSVANYTWGFDEPNGLKHENCAGFSATRGLSDYGCYGKR